MWVLGTKLVSLQEQQVFLTAEIFLQSFKLHVLDPTIYIPNHLKDYSKTNETFLRIIIVII